MSKEGKGLENWRGDDERRRSVEDIFQVILTTVDCSTPSKQHQLSIVAFLKFCSPWRVSYVARLSKMKWNCFFADTTPVNIIGAGDEKRPTKAYLPGSGLVCKVKWGDPKYGKDWKADGYIWRLDASRKQVKYRDEFVLKFYFKLRIQRGDHSIFQRGDHSRIQRGEEFSFHESIQQMCVRVSRLRKRSSDYIWGWHVCSKWKLF